MLRQHVWLWLLGFSGWLGAERAVNLFDSSCKFSSVCTLWLVADQMKFANACSIVLSMSITTRFVMATVWCFFQRILYSAAARLSKVHGQFCERVHVSWSWEFRAVDIFLGNFQPYWFDTFHVFLENIVLSHPKINAAISFRECAKELHINILEEKNFVTQRKSTGSVYARGSEKKKTKPSKRKETTVTG